MADERTRESLKGDFTSITKVSNDVADFYLEASGWDLNAAMAAFFENEAARGEGDGGLDQDQEMSTLADQDDDESDEVADELDLKDRMSTRSSNDRRVITGYKMDGTPIYDLPQGSSTSGGAPAKGLSGLNDIVTRDSSGRGKSSASRSGGRTGGSSNIHGFGTMGAFGGGGSSMDDADDDDDDDNGPQEFFAGGSRSSGQAIQGPPGSGGGRKEDGNPLVQDILKKAMDAGRRRDRGEAEGSTPSASGSSAFFRGSGNTLGSDVSPSTNTAPQQTSASDRPALPAGRGAPGPETEEVVSRDLIFWRDGFSIDDGPLLRYDDPANAAVLRAINEGRAPMSLLNVRHNQNVEVRVARRTNEDYQPPPPKPATPFSGQSNRLGSQAAPSLSSAAADASGDVRLPGSFSAQGAVAESTTKAIISEPEGPSLRIQIRLGDGTRLTSRFSTSGTVRDLRAFVDASAPQTRNYHLQTGFPPRTLQDAEPLSGEDGSKGLGGAVIQQKYT